MTSLAYGALWIFVFSLPWERILVLPGVSILTKVTGGVALVVAVLAVVMSGRVRRWQPYHVAALLFVAWAGGVLMAMNFQEIPAKFWTFVQLFAVIWMIWELARTRAQQVGLLTAYVLGAYVSAVDTILLYRTQGAAMRRFAAGGADPNDSAMLLALALPMAWYLGMIYRQPILRWACRLYVPLGMVALGLTGSRGGMIASLVGLLMVPVTMTRLTPGRRIAAIILLSASVVVAALNTPETLIERLASTGTEVEGANLGGRGKIWVAGFSAFTQKPFIGYGTSGFKAAVRPYGIGQVAHNSYLSVLVEQGLVGFLLYMSMFAAVIIMVLQLPTLERRFGLILLGTLGVAMLPLTWEDQKVVWFILSALTGFSYAIVTANRAAARQAASVFAMAAAEPVETPPLAAPGIARRRRPGI